MCFKPGYMVKSFLDVSRPYFDLSLLNSGIYHSLYICKAFRALKLMDQEEFNNWINALDNQELVDWLLSEVLEEELNEQLYNEGILFIN